MPPVSFVEQSASEFVAVRSELKRELAGSAASGSSSAEQASQAFCTFVYRTFSPSVALARVYAILPLNKLADDAYTFASMLGRSKALTLRAETPVLALLGTAGSKPDWNDRKLSRGHLAIPLATTAFVMSIPMISRLMTEMGGNLKMFDSTQAGLVRRLSMTGLFHVKDAATALDSEDRLIIPAADFVASERVKSVVAVGSSWNDGTFITALLFLRDTVERSQAQRLIPVLEVLKSAAAARVDVGRIFTDPGTLAAAHRSP